MDNRKKFCIDLGALVWAIIFCLVLIVGGVLLEWVAVMRHG